VGWGAHLGRQKECLLNESFRWAHHTVTVFLSRVNSGSSFPLPLFLPAIALVQSAALPHPTLPEISSDACGVARHTT
jgi:hypothetical protein